MIFLFQKDILAFPQVGKLAPLVSTNQKGESVTRYALGAEPAFVKK